MFDNELRGGLDYRGGSGGSGGGGGTTINQLLPVIPRANRIGFIGDSNTEGRNGRRYNNELVYPRWPQVACILSGMRLYPALNVGISGYSTSSALNNINPALLPTGMSGNYSQVDLVIADNPAKCIVMLGTNDIGLTPAVPYATTKSNITTIADRLVAANIEPIFMSPYPIKTGSTLGGNPVPSDVHQQIIRYCTWLANFCATRGYTFLDAYALFAQTSGDPPTTNGGFGDGVHSGVWHAGWVGEMIAAQLTPKVPVWSPYLSKSSDDPTNLLTNPIFTTDADADGIPDGWTKSGTITTRIDNGIGIAGKMFTFDTGNTYITGNETKLSQTISTGFSVGDKLALGGKIKALINNAAGSDYSCRIQFNGAATPTYSPLYSFMATIEGVFHGTYTVPTGTTSITVELVVTSGNGVISFGQPTLQNLTALGVS